MNISVFGKTGTGKSVVSSRIIKSIRSDIPVYMFTDNDYDFEGYQRIEINYQNYKKLNYDKVFRTKRLVFVFTMISDDEINQFFDIFAMRVYLNHRPCIIAIDEAHHFYSKGRHSKNLERIVRGGRKLHIHVIMITQQVVDLDLSMLKQSKYIFVFRLSELNDVYRMSENIQVDPNVILNLNPYHYLLYNVYTGELLEGKEIL